MPSTSTSCADRISIRGIRPDFQDVAAYAWIRLLRKRRDGQGAGKQHRYAKLFEHNDLDPVETLAKGLIFLPMRRQSQGIDEILHVINSRSKYLWHS